MKTYVYDCHDGNWPPLRGPIIAQVEVIASSKDEANSKAPSLARNKCGGNFVFLRFIGEK